MDHQKISSRSKEREFFCCANTDLIKKLDSLSEKNLNRVISVVDPLIENFLSGEDFRMEIKSESHPVE